MGGIKILHCADVHLGAAFEGLSGSLPSKRAADVRQAFLQILDVVKRENVQVLLIAGDLFDRADVPDELAEFVRDGFARLPDVCIAIASGNHDPAAFDSPFRRESFWPGHVHIFGGAWESIIIEEIGVRIWGAGFTRPYQDNSLLGSCGEPSEFVEIGVLHGDIGPSAYNPVSAAQIAQSGLDYLALGHVHQRTEILRAGETFYAYPGSPVSLGFGELGARGVYMGEISRQACELRFMPLKGRECAEISIDVTDRDRRSIVSLILSAMQKRYGDAYEDHLYRIILTGETSEDNLLNYEAIAAAFTNVFYVLIKDHTELAPDPTTVGDMSLRGVFTRRMQERLEASPDDEALRLALKLGLKSFSEKVNFYT